MNAWMRTGAGLWITALAIAGAAQPARSAEPVYLKCPGEVRSVQIDPVKGTKTEEAFRRIYILKVAESSFEVLERQGNDRVWADYCSRPGGGVDCTVTATAIRLRRALGTQDAEVWTIDRTSGAMTIQSATNQSDTGAAYETRNAFNGQCTVVTPSAPEPAEPSQSPH